MRNPWKLTTFALAALLAASISTGAVSSVFADPQPKMREALDLLRNAATALAEGAHDKGGHRAKALELTRGAIVQVEQGIKFDNQH